MTTMTKRDAIESAMTIADDVAQDRLAPAALEQQAVAELRQLFGTVAGPGDACWDLQVSIARQVLALDGIPATELQEWAVIRQRAGELLDQPGLADAPPTPVSLPTVAHSPDAAQFGGAEPAAATGAQDAPAEVAAQHVPTSPRPDHYDPLAAWAAGGTRRNR